MNDGWWDELPVSRRQAIAKLKQMNSKTGESFSFSFPQFRCMGREQYSSLEDLQKTPEYGVFGHDAHIVVCSEFARVIGAWYGENVE